MRQLTQTQKSTLQRTENRSTQMLQSPPQNHPTCTFLGKGVCRIERASPTHPPSNAQKTEVHRCSNHPHKTIQHVPFWAKESAGLREPSNMYLFGQRSLQDGESLADAFNNFFCRLRMVHAPDHDLPDLRLLWSQTAQHVLQPVPLAARSTQVRVKAT